MFTIHVEVSGVVRKMDTLANSAADLEPALRRMGGYMRANALRRYAAQAFPALAQSTLDKRAQKGLHTLERKLSYDLKKAKRRAHDKRRADGLAPRGALARALARLTLKDAIDRVAIESTKGIRNRTAVLEEFQRRHRGGKGGAKLTDAQTRSLNAREERAIARAVGAPILGGLSRTLQVSVKRGTVTLTSATHQHFTEVHNEGGTVGHGARLPARTTLEIDETDLSVFRAILVDELLLGVRSDDDA